MGPREGELLDEGGAGQPVRISLRRDSEVEGRAYRSTLRLTEWGVFSPSAAECALGRAMDL